MPNSFKKRTQWFLVDRFDRLNPATLFSTANVFAYIGSGNASAAAMAAVMAATCATADYYSKHPERMPARLKRSVNVANKILPKFVFGDCANLAARFNAYGLMASGAIALTHGILAGSGQAMLGSGFMIGPAAMSYAAVNFLISSEKAQRYQTDSSITGWRRLLSNPSIYGGFGNIILGFMSGGGLQLVLTPLNNVPALVTTVTGAVSTIAGLNRRRFPNAAAPTMIGSFGCICDTLSAVLTGNKSFIVTNSLCLVGALRVGKIYYDRCKGKEPPAADTRMKQFFAAASRKLTLPLQYIDRLQMERAASLPQPELAPPAPVAASQKSSIKSLAVATAASLMMGASSTSKGASSTSKAQPLEAPLISTQTAPNMAAQLPIRPAFKAKNGIHLVF